MNPILILVISQIFFTTGDLLARHFMAKYGFTPAAFLNLWFFVYVIFKCIGITGQLYVLSQIQVGRTMTLFAVCSIILVNILGVLILKELLSPLAYVGVSFAVLAFLILAFV